MRILYVVEQIGGVFGGSVINHRNLELLQELGNEVELYLIAAPKLSFLQRIREKLKDFRIYGGLTSNTIEDIERIQAKRSFDAVFLAYSRYGALARCLKKRFEGLKVITFFHNVEVIYAYQEARIQSNILKAFVTKILTYWSESSSMKYSDEVIALNQRDASLLEKIYHRKPDVILPTTFRDVGVGSETEQVHAPLRYLFVGSAFYANVQGIRWFVEQVLPFVRGELYVVGKGMACELEEYKGKERLHVIGEVEDLKEWYLNTDLVVCPIFLGSGMKTKTAEAMMYGKPIVGTTEAFVGYEVDVNRVGGCFDDAQGAIDILNEWEKYPEGLQECGRYARKVFVDKYSFETSLRIMESALTELRK